MPLLKIWPDFRWVNIILGEWISWVRCFFHDHSDGMCIWTAIVTSGYTLVFLLHRRSTVTIKIYYWLVVWNIFYFQKYMGCHPSHWLHIFQRGRSTTNQMTTTETQWTIFTHPSKLLDYAGATSCLQYRSFSIMTCDILVGGMEHFHILGSS